jgi:hypothetical protein
MNIIIMYLRSALHAGRRARTRLENVIQLEFQTFQTLHWMTGSLRSMNTMLFQACPCWKGTYWKSQWQWKEQREGSYNQISHPLHRGTEHEN